jgi:hypothetical protein
MSITAPEWIGSIRRLPELIEAVANRNRSSAGVGDSIGVMNRRPASRW